MRLFIIGLSLICGTFAQAVTTPVSVSADWTKIDSLYLHRNVQNNLDQSIVLLKAGLSSHPDDAQALWRLGRSLERLGEHKKDKKEKLATWAEAETALKKSIEINPNIADAHFFLGVTWGRMGQTRGIMKSLFLVGPIKKEMHRTLELDPNFGGAYHVLGEILRQTPGFAGGSKKGAVADLEKAVELSPNHTTIYPDLAEAYLDISETEKAKATLEKVLTIKDPDDPADYDDDLKAAREMLAKLQSK